MSSSWGKKLEKKLSGLADTASKETIQTLSNWITFNRKHANTIATVLTNALQDSKNSSRRQWLYWQLVHEILIREKGNGLKWDKLGEMRLALGEAVQESMKLLGSAMPDQLETFIKEWNDQNVFGGLNTEIPRFFHDRKNLMKAVGNSDSTKTSTSEPDTVRTSATVKSQKSSASSTTAQAALEKEKLSAMMEKSGVGHNEQSTNDDDNTSYPGPNDDNDVAGKEVLSNPSEEIHGNSPSLQKRNSFLKEPVEYDFEKKGIPSGTVESRDFLDPCKAITTLQIVRDIRTNTALEISTALANLPSDILTTCEDVDSGKLEEIDTATTNEFSIRIPSNLIDLDMVEEQSSLNMFQDIVQRQQKAREKLIYLLLRSRCKFGSRETASSFYEIENLAECFIKRKELLSDALELEGLDTNEIGDDRSKVTKRDHAQALPDLTWYKSDENDALEGGQDVAIESNKKQKL